MIFVVEAWLVVGVIWFICFIILSIYRLIVDFLTRFKEFNVFVTLVTNTKTVQMPNDEYAISRGWVYKTYYNPKLKRFKHKLYTFKTMQECGNIWYDKILRDPTPEKEVNLERYYETKKGE